MLRNDPEERGSHQRTRLLIALESSGLNNDVSFSPVSLTCTAAVVRWPVYKPYKQNCASFNVLPAVLLKTQAFRDVTERI